jgi:hypothetical protein
MNTAEDLREELELLRENYELTDKALDKALAELAAAKAEISRLTENQRLQDSATAAVMERAEKVGAELAACREDAERYRWLRDVASRDDWAQLTDTKLEDTDAFIDAARKEGRT